MPDIGGIDIPPAEVLWLGPLSAAIVVRVGVLTTSYPRWPGDPAGAAHAELSRRLYNLSAGKLNTRLNAWRD